MLLKTGPCRAEGTGGGFNYFWTYIVVSAAPDQVMLGGLTSLALISDGNKKLLNNQNGNDKSISQNRRGWTEKALNEKV